MVSTLWGVVRAKKIELLEEVNLPDGARALVILLPDGDESQLWLKASQHSLDAVWNNAEDDVYAQLLQE
jgi:hypothetical protein